MYCYINWRTYKLLEPNHLCFEDKLLEVLKNKRVHNEIMVLVETVKLWVGS